MGKGQIAALAVLALALLAGAIATWGSIGSVVLMLGLLLEAGTVLYQRFLNRDGSDWDTDQ